MENSKKQKLRVTLNELVEISTIQGLPHLFKSKKFFLKLMWILCLLGSSVACFYFVSKCVIDFFQYDYFTSIKYISENQPLFPVITICNNDDQNFEITILRLNFGARDLRINWKNHFEVYNDQSFGRCYRFNSGKNYSNQTVSIKTALNGIFYGLQLDFNINNNNDFNLVYVSINNQSKISNDLFNKGFYLSSGSYNYFSIDRVIEQKLPLPYNDCYEDVTQFPLNKTLINFILTKNQTYTQKDCVDLCRNMYYIETNNKCPNCSLESYDTNVNLCYDSSGIYIQECVLKTIEKFQELDPYKLCAEYCPLECVSFSYDIHQTYQSIPSYGKINNTFDYFNFTTYENVSKRFCGLYFYYEDLKYTFISQQPKLQVFDLVSAMGGLFGLFLGMGLLSFIEIFHMFIEIALILTEN